MKNNMKNYMSKDMENEMGKTISNKIIDLTCEWD